MCVCVCVCVSESDFHLTVRGGDKNAQQKIQQKAMIAGSENGAFTCI